MRGILRIRLRTLGLRRTGERKPNEMVRPFFDAAFPTEGIQRDADQEGLVGNVT